MDRENKTTGRWLDLYDMSESPITDEPQNTPIIDLGSRPCSKHGMDYSTHCDECSHSQFPVAYDPVPAWLWRMGATVDEH